MNISCELEIRSLQTMQRMIMDVPGAKDTAGERGGGNSSPKRPPARHAATYPGGTARASRGKQPYGLARRCLVGVRSRLQCQMYPIRNGMLKDRGASPPGSIV